MKALPPPAPSQLELLPRHRDLVPFVVELNERHEILRALAEILLVAAETVDRKEERDEER
jgi:hypothetical protein